MRSSLVTLSIAALVVAGTVWAGPLPAEDAAGQAHSLVLDGKADAALELLKKHVVDKADDADAWYELARTEFYLMQLDEAQATIARAIKLDPENARYHHLAGILAGYNAVRKAKSPDTSNQVAELMGQWLRESEQTVKLAPQLPDAQVELINAYIQTPPDQGGDRAKAEQLIEELKKASPVAGTKGRCLLIRDADEAITLWKKVVEQHPNDGAARVELAKAYMRKNETENAKEQVEEALKRDASQRSILLDFAQHAAMQNQFKLANDTYQRYLKLDPKPPVPLQATVTFYLAVVARKQQDMDKSEELLAAAKAMDPHVWMYFRPPPHVLFD
jgi:tetratricopeptide (TPR) repeat protein